MTFWKRRSQTSKGADQMVQTKEEKNSQCLGHPFTKSTTTVQL